MRARALAAFFCALTVFLLKPTEPAKAQAKEWPVLTCSTLEQCLDLLKKPYPCTPDCPNSAPPNYDFIDADGGYFSLPAQFEKFGRAGALALLGLLEHADLSIRARAGMVLSELSTIEPEDLPAISRESSNGNGWIDPALARINTPEALSELVSILKKTPDLETQHGSALKSLSNKPMPLLLEALSCKTEHDCTTDFVRVIGELASQRGIQPDQIRDRLIDIATTREQFIDTRLGALQALARLKPMKEADRSRIRLLLNDPEAKIRNQTKAVLVAWPDEMAPLLEPSDCAINYTQYDNSGKFVSKGCQTYAEFPPSMLKVDRLRYIGALGPAGQARTPYVLELLGDDDWEVRAEAAKALGLMGETKAIPDLTAAIDASDWQLTLEATTSLRKLKAAGAEDILRNIAAAYWQPGIRAAARRLLDGTPEPRTPDGGWHYRSAIDAHCNSADAGKGATSGMSLTSHPDLAYAARAESTISVEGGRLVAYNAGEFGGMLEFQPIAGASTELLKDEAVVAVISSTKGIFALTGTPHMRLDNGFIHKVERAVNGNWAARAVWRLPGAPLDASYTRDGTMGISTNYGDVIFRPDSGMEWISCPARQ